MRLDVIKQVFFKWFYIGFFIEDFVRNGVQTHGGEKITGKKKESHHFNRKIPILAKVFGNDWKIGD